MSLQTAYQPIFKMSVASGHSAYTVLMDSSSVLNHSQSLLMACSQLSLNTETFTSGQWILALETYKPFRQINVHLHPFEGLF